MKLLFVGWAIARGPIDAHPIKAHNGNIVSMDLMVLSRPLQNAAQRL
ncbi:hypothetical protein [Pendulispora albinea]|uniref:Uncharacterized protein n=1 Tax=Pendulispora albinea TaxID=2741071 RepID=A0ABZ2M744_9BACT